MSTRTRHVAVSVLLLVVLALIAARAGLRSSPALAQETRGGMIELERPQPLQTTDLSADQAHAVLAAAMRRAGEIDTKMNIAVVDAGRNLKAFIRMDGAWLGSIDIAIRKARTARYFDMPTGDIGELAQPGGSLYNIEHSNGGLITFPGGVPLYDANGRIIGAVGVSGSSVENDHTVATAGAAALE